MTETLFARHSSNPILTSKDWPYPVHTVFNPGVTEVEGEIVLLVRCEDKRGVSHLTVARSQDGITNWKITDTPTIEAEPDQFPEEKWGVEDARVTYLANEKRWVITYTSYSTSGPLVSMMETNNFKTFKKRGVILPPENKDAALFPEQINKKWVLIHRPVSQMNKKINMWLSTSEDMIHWGNHKLLFEARDGSYWDAHKIGLSAPPLKTDKGWLVLYHGVKPTNNGDLYRLGLALLDLKDPSQVLRRSSDWIFGPEEPYELVGDISNVVFPCGWVHKADEDKIYMYYGAADTSIGLATGSFSQIMKYVMQMPKANEPTI